MKEEEKIDSQVAFVDTVNTLVDRKLLDNNISQSHIGRVIQRPELDEPVLVDVQGVVVNCSLPQEKHYWIQQGDIVVIQDLRNNREYIITSKIGNDMSTPSLVFADEDDNIVSGVDAMFEADEETYVNHATIIDEERGITPTFEPAPIPDQGLNPMKNIAPDDATMPYRKELGRLIGELEQSSLLSSADQLRLDMANEMLFDETATVEDLDKMIKKLRG